MRMSRPSDLPPLVGNVNSGRAVLVIVARFVTNAFFIVLTDIRTCPDADTKTVRSWPPKLSASGQFLQCPIPLIPPHYF